MLRVTNVNYIRLRPIEDSSFKWKSFNVSSFSLALTWQRLPIRWKLVVSDWPIKVKRKVAILNTKKTCRVRRGIASLILNLDTRWGWFVSLTSRPMYCWVKIPPPNTHWTGGGVCPPDCPNVAWSRCQLSYPDSINESLTLSTSWSNSLPIGWPNQKIHEERSRDNKPFASMWWTCKIICYWVVIFSFTPKSKLLNLSSVFSICLTRWCVQM
jgi:hypothetical protein